MNFHLTTCICIYKVYFVSFQEPASILGTKRLQKVFSCCHTLFHSMGSASRGVNASPPCDSDVSSPSQAGYAKREFIMMPPEEKLQHFDSRAQAHEDNQEVGTV